MESPLAGNLSSVREKVMEKLIRGRGYAAQLQIHLSESTGSGHGSTTAEDQVTKVLRSFTEALSLLSCSGLGEVPASSPCRDQRGNLSKTRKMHEMHEMHETWTMITAMPIEDGYVWRKYGQKEILNSKHLRCYLRCTYRFDKGCQATKQVQRTEDDPPMFWNKYIGHHTCQLDVLRASFVMDSTAGEGLLLNFESNTLTKQEPPIFFSSFPSSKEEHKIFFPSIKQEYNPSSSEYPPPPDLTKFKSFISSPALLSTLQSGHENVVSGCTTSSSNSFDKDMEFMMGSAYLNDAFLFSDGELF